MTVRLQAFQSALSSAFRVPVSCELLDERTNRIEIRLDALPRPSGFYIEVFRPYKNSCKALLAFDSFATPLLERWFSDRTQIEEAYAFVESISRTIDISVSIAGIPAKDATEFLELAAADWKRLGVRVKCAWREIPSDERERDYLATAIAILGFALFASGFVNRDEFGAPEGRRHEILVSRAERSRANRARCIAHHGSRCAICGFDFGETYGDFAEGFIEVHHINPVGDMERACEVDPINDLIPLCPNCHAAVHLQNPPIDPQVLKSIVDMEGSK